MVHKFEKQHTQDLQRTAKNKGKLFFGQILYHSLIPSLRYYLLHTEKINIVILFSFIRILRSK